MLVESFNKVMSVKSELDPTTLQHQCGTSFELPASVVISPKSESKQGQSQVYAFVNRPKNKIFIATTTLQDIESSVEATLKKMIKRAPKGEETGEIALFRDIIEQRTEGIEIFLLECVPNKTALKSRKKSILQKLTRDGYNLYNQSQFQSSVEHFKDAYDMLSKEYTPLPALTEALESIYVKIAFQARRLGVWAISTEQSIVPPTASATAASNTISRQPERSAFHSPSKRRDSNGSDVPSYKVYFVRSGTMSRFCNTFGLCQTNVSQALHQKYKGTISSARGSRTWQFVYDTKKGRETVESFVHNKIGITNFDTREYVNSSPTQQVDVNAGFAPVSFEIPASVASTSASTSTIS